MHLSGLGSPATGSQTSSSFLSFLINGLKTQTFQGPNQYAHSQNIPKHKFHTHSNVKPFNSKSNHFHNSENQWLVKVCCLTCSHFLTVLVHGWQKVEAEGHTKKEGEAALAIGRVVSLRGVAYKGEGTPQPLAGV